MIQVTVRKTNINRQVNEIYISFMKAVIVMRKGTRRQLELPDELVVASWPVLASDESDFEDESEDQRTKKSNKKLTSRQAAQVDTNVGAHNKRGTISKVIKTIRVVCGQSCVQRGGRWRKRLHLPSILWRVGPCSVQRCGQSESVSPTSSLLSRRSSSSQLSGSFRRRK